MKVYNAWASWEQAKNDLASHLSSDTLASLDRAFKYAIAHHSTQTRPTGEPFVSHLLQVLEILVNGVHVDDKDILLAGVLHDIVEDTTGTIKEISKKFGKNVARLVEWLTMPPIRNGESKKEVKDRYLVNLQSAPSDVIIIKLADRYSNVQRLVLDPRPEKRRAYYRETIARIFPLIRGYPFFESLFKEWQNEYSYLDKPDTV